MSTCIGLDIHAAMPALADLTDVALTAPADTEVLTYDSGTGKWINAPGGGLTLPITAAANDVVLEGPGPTNLLTLDAVGFPVFDPQLTVSMLQVGNGPFATAGTIRWSGTDSIIGLDGGGADLEVLALAGGAVSVGPAAATHFTCDIANGAFEFNAIVAGPEQVFVQGSVSGTPTWLMQVTDAGNATNALKLEGPGDGNYFGPSTGLPDLGRVTDPWGGIFGTAYHVGGNAGADFSGPITNLTIEKGIVTAAS